MDALILYHPNFDVKIMCAESLVIITGSRAVLLKIKQNVEAEDRRG